LSDYTVYGSEVLLRWEHPELGFVSPDEFVKVAEDLGIISDLTQWVIECALEQQKALVEAGYKHNISINISGKDVIDPRFYTRVSETIKRSSIHCSDITLELTESVTVEDHNIIKKLMKQFNGIGVRFSIDDFGTGYSSMEALSEFSFHELKIDRTFVMNILESNRNYIIASNTIDLANRLNLATVAEGVENEQLVSLLKSSKCLIGQGYYFLNRYHQIIILNG
jgi:EAL domain-containing protein (putative c-di-GMP-specific phosphodiesterase class I)